jgi:hypothetical protein
MKNNRDSFPPDETANFPTLLERLMQLNPSDTFGQHLVVVEVMAKCGLCSESEYTDFINMLENANLRDEQSKYLKIIAGIGRCSVYGPSELHRSFVDQLRKLSPSDEILSYSICDAPFE